MNKQISSIGSFMALAGIISSVLSFFDYNLRILTWIDNWGYTAGWGIRIGLIVVGAILFFVFKQGEEEEKDSAPEQKDTE